MREATRSSDEFRHTSISIDTITEAHGSCSLSLGNTLVHVSMYGPGPCERSFDEKLDRANLTLDFVSVDVSG